MIHSSINFIILIFMFIPFLLIISILVFDIVVMSIMYHCCNIYWNQNHFCLQIMSINVLCIIVVIYIEIKTIFACRYDVDSASQQLDQHVR